VADGGALAGLLAEVATGRFPPPDGSVRVVPQPSARDAGVIAFTAHSVVFTDADPDWVREQLPPGDLAAPLSAAFLQALSSRSGRTANCVDLLSVATSLAGPPPIELTPVTGPAPGDLGPGGGLGPGSGLGSGGDAWATDDLAAGPGPAHPRVARALRFRDDVRVWRADGGVLLIGRGVAGRWEIAVEVDDGRRGEGIGRALASAARHLVPAGAPLWAQIAPGNAASVRAFLAAGFRPAGAEALLVPEPTE